METITVRYESCSKALDTLQHALTVLADPRYDAIYNELRDSVIQRFKFSIDTLWKLLKEYLTIKHEVDFPTAGPKTVVREAVNKGIISQETYLKLLELIDDRNITSHTYNEELAQQVSKKIAGYYELMRSVLNSIKI